MKCLPALLLRILISAFTAIPYSCNAEKRTVYPEAGALQHGINSQTLKLDSFLLHWDSIHAQLKITHLSDTSHLLWSSIAGKSWLMAAQGEGYFEDKRGTFILHESAEKFPFIHQHIEAIYYRDSAAIIGGKLSNQKGSQVPFTQIWKATPEGHLQWQFFSDSHRVNRLYVSYEASPDEYIVGMGEQPTHFNHKGNMVPVLVQEQGIGRGDIRSCPVKLVLGPSTGNAYTTYKAVPHYISSKGQSLMLENDAYSEFDFRQPDKTGIRVFDTQITGRILPGKNPADFVESYTRYSGRMRLLPDWVHSGAIVGMQGGTDKVYQVWKSLKEAGTPISAFWLQDWVGQRKTILGQQLWWNWELDTLRYPRWKEMTDSLQKSNISVMGYINPFIVEVEGQKNGYRRNLFQEAADSGFLVMKDNGAPYYNVTSFKAALLDLSHPGCRKWIKQIIKDELITAGLRGWMADFGEALPFEVKLKEARSTATYHNRYAQEWAQLNREVIEEAGFGDDITFFSRSAYTRSPAYSTLFWQGDQMVDWGKNDGLPSALTGLLSSGLSGFSFNHSDIGGYATIDFPLGVKITRSKELLERWMQLSAFSVVYRTHEGLAPDKNHQVYSDSSTSRKFAYWAKVHQAWKFYRDMLIREAAEKGWPVARSMAFVFPEDEEAWKCNHLQMIVGNDLLIVPVLTPDTEVIRFYLPKGAWINAWTGAIISSSGEYFILKGYQDKPGIFYPKGSQIGEQFRNNLSDITF